MPRLVPRPLVPPSKVRITRELGHYTVSTLDLDATNIESRTSWTSFLGDADSSSRKCVSEGPEEVLPVDSIVVCKECGYSTSRKNAFPPRRYEEHDFIDFDQTVPRCHPTAYRVSVLTAGLGTTAKVCVVWKKQELLFA